MNTVVVPPEIGRLGPGIRPVRPADAAESAVTINEVGVATGDDGAGASGGAVTVPVVLADEVLVGTGLVGRREAGGRQFLLHGLSQLEAYARTG